MNSSNVIGGGAAIATPANELARTLPTRPASMTGFRTARNRPLERTNFPFYRELLAVVAVVDRPGRGRLGPQRFGSRTAQLLEVLGPAADGVDPFVEPARQ